MADRTSIEYAMKRLRSNRQAQPDYDEAGAVDRAMALNREYYERTERVRLTKLEAPGYRKGEAGYLLPEAVEPGEIEYTKNLRIFRPTLSQFEVDQRLKAAREEELKREAANKKDEAK